jgi:hypothetical protein
MRVGCFFVVGFPGEKAEDRHATGILVRELIRDVAPGGGYIMTSGNSLADYLKPECVRAISRTIDKYGHYPITME